MLYIVTYATHNQRYFDFLKQSYPNIIVLGWNTQWKGFYDKIKGVIDFCKDKNNDDLILFIDGFDSVVLHTDDIIEKYKSFNSLLVFSKDMNSYTLVAKYMKDSVFSSCRLHNLNSGLYIGPPYAIIEFWKDIKLDDDDQVYATKKCKLFDESYVTIDATYKLFYNFNNHDTIEIIDKKIKINKEYPNIISAPALGNINNILINLGYNIDNVTNEIKSIHYINRLIQNINRHSFELFFIIIFSLFIYFNKNKQLIYQLGFLLFLELLNYKLYINHLNVNNISKFIYLFIDLIQLGILTYISINSSNCNIKNILILNILIFSIVLLFYIFKKCIFKVLKEYLTGINQHSTIYNKLNYLLNINDKYNINDNNNDNDYNNLNNIYISNIIFIIYINIKCLITS